MALCALCSTTGLLADDSSQLEPTSVPDSEFLEARQARIGEILIDNENIFDLDNPEENHKLYRAANKLHVKTRPKVIRRQLLFKTGDLFDQRLLEESERILRSNHYLHDATIRPLRYADGVVDILVQTTDVWTLDPRFSFGRSGGENTATIGIKDENLLGTGVYFGLYQRFDIDRDSTEIAFSDHELGSTHYAISGSYADNSDGSRMALAYGRPFYALDAHRSNGFLLDIDDRVDSLYDRGEIQAEFRHQLDAYRASYGFSDGLKDGWVKRYSVGLGFEEDRFEAVKGSIYPNSVIPDDRKFVYPYFQWELVQDRYEESRNHDQIGRTEDRFLGTRLQTFVGLASQSFGSLDDAMLLQVSASSGFGDSDHKSLITSLDYHGRLQQDGLHNSLLSLGAVYHQRQGQRGLLHVSLSANFGSELDLDNPLYLGGDNGLRGYPLRYQGGETSALLTVEERLFTHWYPFRLIHIGGALFFDAGQTWGPSPVGGENLGLLRDVGFGLRFGNSRSGIGRVVHLDFAFPLDGDDSIDSMQILLRGKTSF